ncbi:MAG TPA: fatty acyl-AMP ligase [Candidatus Acidoferrales bacterium]|nr:fatty acyl-AMP ligase [Candidatus Acidoferrales bacterium]
MAEVLRRRTEAAPDETHLHLWQDNDQIEPLTYSELLHGAAAVARGLRACGLRSGETAAIMLPTGRDFFFSFLGVWLAGGIPVPIYPPFRADKLEEYARRQSAILHNAQARVLITFRQVERLARLLKPRVPSLLAVVTAERLLHRQGPKQTDGRSLPAAEELTQSPSLDDVALIQYTSGSTGEPRGVALTHRNLLANLRAIGHGVQVRPDDVTICWLPLYHDMGLIGCWLFSLYFGLPITVLSPLAFLRRPERWLRAIHRYRGTLSPAPNFAYELCARKIDDRALEGLDLSSWRVALNGAEPVSADTIARFTRRFALYGFRPEAMMPVYGLAESSVALTFAPLERPPRVHAVARDVFQRHRRAEPASESEAEPLRFVSVGRPLPEHEVRVVDDADRPVGEGVEGHLQFRGPSAMQGYYRNAEATAAALTADGWYRTGDLAYCADGEIFITGRTKDLIIKAGRNIYPQEIEEVASDVAGIRRGCVVAFAVPDPRNGTDALVLVAETRETDPAVQARLATEVKRLVGTRCQVSPEVVHLVPPQVVPKTPSGKIRRAACREMYLQDALNASKTPVWLQVARLLAGNTLAQLKKRIS